MPSQEEFDELKGRLEKLENHVAGAATPQFTDEELAAFKKVSSAMADTGDAWPLIEGTGRIYGLYVIESLQTTRTLFFSGSISSTVPVKLDSGPSVIRTVSPTW